MTFIDCLVDGNVALGSRIAGGGGIEVAGALIVAEFVRCMIVDNTALNGDGASGRGGGIKVSPSAADELQNTTVIVIDCTVARNIAPNGGGVFNAANFTTINSSIENNIANDTGGGLYNTGVAALKNRSMVRGNEALRRGSSLYNGRTLTYTLPAPLGYYLTGVSQCSEDFCLNQATVSEESCPTQSCPDVTRFQGEHLYAQRDSNPQSPDPARPAC
jgi:hypothetical protein